MDPAEKLKTEINSCLSVLKNGGTILCPTDTIWGISCDATNTKAIEKIFDIKKRPQEKGMIMLIHDDNLLMKYVKEVPPAAWELVEYSENPLTIIYPGAINLPASMVHHDGSIAIRVVKKGFVFELLRKFQKPLVSTSANISGDQAPVAYNQVSEVILGAVDYVVALQLDASGTRQPSAIIELAVNGTFRIIRK